MSAHRFDLCVVIRANVTRYLCDSAKHLPLSIGCERVPQLNEDLRRVLCEVTVKSTRRKSGTAGGGRLGISIPPQQAVASTYTVHSLPHVFALLCLFCGRAFQLA